MSETSLFPGDAFTCKRQVTMWNMSGDMSAEARFRQQLVVARIQPRDVVLIVGRTGSSCLARVDDKVGWIDCASIELASVQTSKA